LVSHIVVFPGYGIEILDEFVIFRDMTSSRKEDLWSAGDGVVDIECSGGEAVEGARDGVDLMLSGRRLSRDLSSVQKLRFKLFGRVFVGLRNRRGRGASLPFYAFKCPVHGIVEDYPHGYHGRLDCPLCLGENELIRAFRDFSSGEKRD
jgi:hypothetical protein